MRKISSNSVCRWSKKKRIYIYYYLLTRVSFSISSNHITFGLSFEMCLIDIPWTFDATDGAYLSLSHRIDYYLYFSFRIKINKKKDVIMYWLKWNLVWERLNYGNTVIQFPLVIQQIQRDIQSISHADFIRFERNCISQMNTQFSNANYQFAIIASFIQQFHFDLIVFRCNLKHRHQMTLQKRLDSYSNKQTFVCSSNIFFCFFFSCPLLNFI